MSVIVIRIGASWSKGFWEDGALKTLLISLPPPQCLTARAGGGWPLWTSEGRQLYNTLHHYGLDEYLETSIRGTRASGWQVLGGIFPVEICGFPGECWHQQLPPFVVSVACKRPRRSCMGGRSPPWPCIRASMRNSGHWACLRPQQRIGGLSVAILLNAGEKSPFALHKFWGCCHLKHSSKTCELHWAKKEKKRKERKKTTNPLRKPNTHWKKGW